MKFKVGEKVEIKGTGIVGEVIEQGEFNDGVIWYRVKHEATHGDSVATAWSEESLITPTKRENVKGFTGWLSEAIESQAQLDGVQTTVRVQGEKELVVESNGVRFVVSVKTL